MLLTAAPAESHTGCCTAEGMQRLVDQALWFKNFIILSLRIRRGHIARLLVLVLLVATLAVRSLRAASSWVAGAGEVHPFPNRLPQVRCEHIRIIVLARPASKLRDAARQRPRGEVALLYGGIPPWRIALANDDAAWRGEARPIASALCAVLRLVKNFAARLRHPVKP